MASAATPASVPNAPRRPTSTSNKPIEDARLGPFKAYYNEKAELKVQVHNWQRIAFACVGLAAIAVIGAILESTQPKMIPYLVAIDKTNGQYVNAGMPPRLDQAGDIVAPMVQYTVKQFITSVRTVTPDQDHQTQLVNENVKPFVDGESQAAALITDFYKTSNPFDLGAKEIVTVDTDIPTPISGSTYQISWTETTEGLDGKVLKNASYVGTATTTFHAVPPGLMQKYNPLGIYIKEIHYNLKDGSSQATTK
jgi:type IV secretion system protein VirB5